MEAFLKGFFLQASLILALGSQNLFLLDLGFKRQFHLSAALTCFICDLVLIFIGTLGLGAFFNYYPKLKILMGVLGVAFLFFYSFSKIKEGLSNQKKEMKGKEKSTNRKKTILMALSFSLLNPHVYLDTVVLIGGFSASFSEFQDRLFFALGTISISGLWFFSLVLFASIIGHHFKGEESIRRISLVSGGILFFLGAFLAVDIFSWVKELYV